MAAVYPDGTPIPDDELESAQQSGQVRFESPDTEVHFVTGDGTRVTGKASDYQTVMKRGGRLEPQAERAAREQAAAERAEFESTEEMAKTAAEGVVRGVPLVGGLLYAGLVESGVIDRERSQKRQEYNPGIELAGEILSPMPGAVLGKALGLGAKALKAGDRASDLVHGVSAAINAPTTLAGKAATAAEHTAEHLAGRLGGGKLAQKVVGYAAGGAIDGAQYAVNQEIAQAAQEDRLTELDGKMLAHALGHGASIGALVGGALGGAIEGSRAASGKLQSWLAKEGNDARLRSTGLTQVDLAKAVQLKGEEKVMRAARRLDEEKIVKVGNSVDDNFKALLAAEKDANKALSTIRKEIDASGATTVEHVAVPGVIKRGGSPVTRAVERRTLAIDAAELADRMRSAVQKPAETGIAAEVGAHLNGPQLRMFERKVLAPIDEMAAKGGQITFAEAAKLRREIAGKARSFKNPNGIAEDVMRDAQGALEDLVEESITRAESAGLLPAKQLERYKAAKARSEDLITLRGLAQKHLGKAAGRSPISGLDQAMFALGAAGSIATGDTGAAGAAAQGAALAIGTKVLRRYQNPALSFIAQRLSEFATRKNAATEAIVVGSLHQAASEPRSIRRAATIIAERETRPSYMQAVATTLAHAEQTPEQEAAQHGAIAEGNEPVYSGYLSASRRTTAYLASQIPTPVTRGSVSLTPQAEEPMVSTVEQRKFVDKFQAARDPIGAMEELAEGKLNLDKIEAVKATAPELYEEMRAGVALGLAKSYKPIPYKRRIQLGLAFDLPADKSLTQLPEIQATVSPPAQATAAPQQPSTTISKQQSRSTMLPSQAAGMGM